MASSAASSSSPTTGKDDKIVRLLAMTFAKLDDFKEDAATATSYAAAVAAAARTHSNTDEDFRDQVMSIVANVKNLNGQIRSADSTISAAELAVMDANSMRSHQQKKQVAAVNRKRAREQTNIDKTSLHCTKCGLVRRDRLNINELALDSEESGSHFDYNFDNVCTCTHSSEEESSTDTDDDDDDKSSSSSSSRSNSSTSRSGSESS